jgi:hypothetical protein
MRLPLIMISLKLTDEGGRAKSFILCGYQSSKQVLWQFIGLNPEPKM